MELLRTNKLVYILIAFGGSFILALGSWWLYLLIRLSESLKDLNIASAYPELKILNMIKWEGLTFLILFILFAALLVYIYVSDIKKSLSLQSFFASMTHELKTPLASIKLQAEFINELIQDEELDLNQVKKLSHRLIEDTNKLENEVDKTLQLARVQRDGNLSTSRIAIKSFIERLMKRYSGINFTINGDDYTIFGDEFALSLCLRNLIENTLRHNKEEHKNVIIDLSSKENKVKVSYKDNGKPFTGDLSSLGKIFYKYDSAKGSGIGLYLIKKLTLKMNGQFHITNKDSLKFHLSYPLAKMENEL
jgi:signal transduction histidine kinase